MLTCLFLLDVSAQGALVDELMMLLLVCITPSLPSLILTPLPIFFSELLDRFGAALLAFALFSSQELVEFASWWS